MLIRKADALPSWNENNALSGIYGPNTIVWYQKNSNTAGYCYRAKSTYVKSSTPPNEDSNWEIDYTYHFPWKEDGKYNVGSKVYYFNGQNTYGYKASIRYFGGSGKPNEEVDDDGIRTWELDFQYIEAKSNNFGIYSYLGRDILIPVRKKCGYVDGKAYPINPIDPEELMSPVGYEVNGQQLNRYEYVVYYLQDNGIISKNYTEINSIFQSDIYDNTTYIFNEDKADSNGNLIKRKKSIHRAKYAKEKSSNLDIGYVGDRQFLFTLYSTLEYSYMRKHGFSIEMWPNINDNDFILVPMDILWNNDFFFQQSTQYSVAIGDYPYYSDGLAVNGGDTDPNTGVHIPETPDSQCKTNLRFYYNSNNFRERTINTYFLIQKVDTYWEQFPIYSYDGNGNSYISGYSWSQRERDPIYSFDKYSADSKEESFKYDFIIRDVNDNPLDFSSYKKAGSYTSIYLAGWSIE